MQSGLLFTTPAWFTLLCVVTGALYAWGLYSPVPSWSKTVNWGLATLRGLIVAVICFLLIGPRIKRTETSVDKARVVVAVDNSGSMESLVPDSLMVQLETLTADLRSAGYDVSALTLSGNNELDSLSYELGTTDLSGMLRTVRSDYEGENLTDVVLLTDGIVNQGSSPAFGIYPFKVHTIAVGDTLPARDIRIAGVRANQVAFLGNQFPVQADISAFGMNGRQMTLTLRQGRKVLSSKTLSITEENYFETVDFLVSSSEKGLQRLTLELGVVSGERTQANNQREIYIDIIDGRENILLLALSPHPDLKVFRNVVSQNENYELDIHMMSLGPIPDELLKKKYDLLILHQLPDVYNLGNNPQVAPLVSGDIPVWYFYGNQSGLTAFNRVNGNVTILSDATQHDQVTGRFNKAFNTILLDAERLNLLQKLPPLLVPFGEYTLSPGAETVLFQRIGSLDTQKPLLTVNVNRTGRKTAAFLGDGIWLWRQEEYSQTGKTEIIDELVLKMIQLLAIKEDKRKFRVTPASREFTTREPVVLQTEIYNDVYERTYGQEVILRVTNDENATSNFNYVNLEGQPNFTISGLEEGAYRYTASTVIKGKTERAEGRFLVRDINLESINEVADHGMLRELSGKTGGRFLYPGQIEGLTEQLVSSRSPDRLNSTEEVVGIIYLKWLFFLLVLLASLEWATRKYLGGY